MFDDRSHRPDDESRPERPRSEPEIIPPSHGRARGESRIWMSTGRYGGTHRIYIAQPGPFGIILALIVAGLVLAAIVLVLLGLVLFWIPVVVLVVAAFLLSGYLRYYWRRFQLWLAGR